MIRAEDDTITVPLYVKKLRASVNVLAMAVENQNGPLAAAAIFDIITATSLDDGNMTSWFAAAFPDAALDLLACIMDPQSAMGEYDEAMKRCGWDIDQVRALLEEPNGV